jgi:NAD(P)-dependent dehydrogenase (short-subunit alcohol dehydrogenase family)
MLGGRVGIVTASGNGIGRASAIAFAAAGATVVVSDIDDVAGAETVRLITSRGGTAFYQHADVSNEVEVDALVTATVERYGRLDWAHNNAAAGAATTPITEQRASTWQRVLAVTLIGTMLCLKYELAQMQQQQHGAIVNTASTAGLVGVPNQSPYVAAKWGVIGLTKTAALENAAIGIRVNAICPGVTATGATLNWSSADPNGFEAMRSSIPMGVLSEPEQQADVAVWLCSDAASYLTGVAIPVDGGISAG